MILTYGRVLSAIEKAFWKLRGVLRSQKVPLELGGELEEEHSLVGEDWSCNRVEIGFRRREQEGGEQR